MKIINFSETVQHKNSDRCIALEYPLGDPAINIAHITIDGRYPETGTATNTKCKEICYVINGEGSVVIEGNKFPLRQGDAVLIEPSERYYWEGVLTLLVPCTPAWSQEQHIMTD